MYFISTEKYNFDTMQGLILEINFEFLLMQKPPIVNPFEGGFHQSALRRAKKDLAIVKFKEGGFFFLTCQEKVSQQRRM